MLSYFDKFFKEENANSGEKNIKKATILVWAFGALLMTIGFTVCVISITEIVKADPVIISPAGKVIMSIAIVVLFTILLTFIKLISRRVTEK